MLCYSLVPCFEQGYKDAIMEAQALRVNYSSESKKREALESHIADLKRGLTEISTFFRSLVSVCCFPVKIVQQVMIFIAFCGRKKN
jgi:hypothetical protein